MGITLGNEVDVVRSFISEDDLKTFDGWLRYQGFDASTTAPEELETWRDIFDDVRARSSASSKLGLMKLRPMPLGEHRYAVSVREGVDLWLTLWVRRSPKGEFFVMVPRGDQDWDIHTSYHLDGTLHMKSHGRMDLPSKKCQVLTGAFRGTQPLVTYAGYAPSSVGAICDPTAFSGIVELAPGILGPRDGQITVDLVEPGCQPAHVPWVKVARQEVFRDILPWVVITVGSCG